MNTPSADTTPALPGPDDILRVELDTGLLVLARENFASPSVVVNGLLHGGSLQEPPEKAGLAGFHGAMLTRGTARHSFEDLYEEIESIGASLSASAGRHIHEFGSKSLAEDLPLMLHLLAEVLSGPTFPEDHLEIVRGQIVTRLQMRAHDTRRMASLAFRELAYPADHPYARSSSGYLDTIAAISRDDIVNFHQQIGPRGAIVVVVGAVRASDAIDLVEKAFGSWLNPAQAAISQAAPVPRLTERHERTVPIPGKTQADIMLGYPGPARSAPDFQAARLANSILGVFGMMGRLGDKVREEQGLAYYSYSGLTGGLGPGPWQITAGVAPENVERAVASVREEVQRIVAEPVTPEELSDNKSFFKGQLAIALETNEGVSSSIMTMELHQLGLDYLHRYADTIDAITADEIQAAAQHYLDPDVYALAIAGPAQS